jgi:hypothetical protein
MILTENIRLIVVALIIIIIIVMALVVIIGSAVGGGVGGASGGKRSDDDDNVSQSPGAGVSGSGDTSTLALSGVGGAYTGIETLPPGADVSAGPKAPASQGLPPEETTPGQLGPPPANV